MAVGETAPSLAADNKPYTTVGYANGLGFRNLGDETDADASYASAAVAGRVELQGIDTTTPGFHQETTVPLASETHAGEDISLHATGPSAQLAQGVIEQNVVFHIINQALELTQQ